MSLDGQTIWIIIGVILLIGEMLTAGFYLLFLSIGCFAAAIAAGADSSYFVQGAVCASVSILGMFTLRRPIQRKLLKGINVSADIGKEIQVNEDIAPQTQTRIDYQGTSWLATNLGAEALKRGDRVVIVGIDGNVLLIRKFD